jgi:Bcr/CflA subfamily drug resistance transporter
MLVHDQKSEGGHLSSGQRKRAFFSMLIMVPLAGAATDIYIPSLPAMAHVFDASRFAIQSTLLVFMACYGIGQIIAGPLTDTFGRRTPILLSTIVFVLASIGIAMAPPLWIVIALRGVQGLFGACSAVGARAIVADCYDGAERIRAANWMTVAWATGPILSPALGGYLQAWFGWTAAFWVLAGWGTIVVLVALLVLPETRVVRPETRFIQAFKLYGRMATDRVYLPTALGMACLISVMYGFEALAPFYIQTDLKHNPIFYGQLQLILGCLWLAGNILNRILNPHVKVIRIITAAAGISLLVSLLMLVLDLSGVFSVMALVVPVGIVYFLMAMIWPNGYSKCLGRFPDAGGSANALVSGLFIIVSAFFTAVASLLQSPTAWPMWVLYLFVTAAALVCFRGFLYGEFDDTVR